MKIRKLVSDVLLTSKWRYGVDRYRKLGIRRKVKVRYTFRNYQQMFLKAIKLDIITETYKGPNPGTLQCQETRKKHQTSGGYTSTIGRKQNLAFWKLSEENISRSKE